METHKISRVQFDNPTTKNTNPWENLRVKHQNPNLQNLGKIYGFGSYLDFSPKWNPTLEDGLGHFYTQNTSRNLRD